MTIPAGQASATFDIDAVDDALLDGTQTVTITASAAAHADGSDTVDVVDDDPAVLTVTIAAASVSEAAGSAATTATVTHNVVTPSAVTVTLASNDPSEATVPTSVTIPQGQMSATFDIDAVDDSLVDGTQQVTITASSPGFADGVDLLNVTDDDVAGFSVTETDGYTLVFEDGSIDTFDIVLDAEPSDVVVLNVSSADTDEVTATPATLTFTPNTWNLPQSVTVTGVDDPIVDGDQNDAGDDCG